MAVAGIALTMGGFWAASKIIDWAGGDPEGAVAGEMAYSQGMAAAQSRQPFHRARYETQEELAAVGAQERRLSAFAGEATEWQLGRRTSSARDLLESVAQSLGTSPEDLGRKLSPTRMGDYSSLSRAAFGRTAARKSSPNGG